MKFKKKKTVFIILPFITIMFYFFVNYKYTNRITYPIGKDTVEILGNGRFQIIELYSFQEGKIYALQDLETQKTLDNNVIKYKIIKNNMYTISNNGYTVLNYKTGEYYKEQNIEKLKDIDREVFKKKISFKTL